MDIVLIAGLWLDGSAWEAVVPQLRAMGHKATPVSLPGQGVPPAKATLEDQLATVLASVDAAATSVLVVGHSAACSLAWMAPDARPDRVARVAMIGGFPAADGDTYADGFELVDGFVPFPGWEAFAAAAIPIPEAVAKGVVHLRDQRRFDVPVTLICPEFSPAQAQEWIDGGEVPELSRARHLSYVDIDSGHWPMFSRPTELATLLAAIADA